MADILLQIANPTRVTGEAVVVEEDSYPFSEEERRLFAVVRVPGTKAQVAATYLKGGMPDAVRAAHDVAQQAIRDAAPRGRAAILAAVEVNRAALEAADVAAYPRRNVRIDPLALPSDVRTKVGANWTARLGVASQAKSTSDAAALDALEPHIGRTLTAQERSRGPAKIAEELATLWQDATPRQQAALDAARESMFAAAKTAGDSVEREALRGVLVPDPVVWTQQELDAATIAGASLR